MKNIDALIYTNGLVNELEKNGFFSPNTDPFMEKDLLHVEILKLATENFKEYGDPMLSEEQFDLALTEVRKKTILETFDDLVNDGFLDIDGIDKDGEFLYTINKNKKK